MTYELPANANPDNKLENPTADDIVVLPELKAYIDPLTPDEYESLERSIMDEGCRDSLVLWGNILIDGHNQMVARRGADLTHQLTQLRRIVIVAGKQDQSTHQRMRQNFTLLRIQLKPFYIQHDWTHIHLSYPLVCN